jgi:hypothetical protein
MAISGNIIMEAAGAYAYTSIMHLIILQEELVLLELTSGD